MSEPTSLLTFSGRRHLVGELHEERSRWGKERYWTAKCNASITMDPDHYQDRSEVGLCKRCFPTGALAVPGLAPLGSKKEH